MSQSNNGSWTLNLSAELTARVKELKTRRKAWTWYKSSVVTPEEVLRKLLDLDNEYLPEGENDEWSIEQIDEFITKFKKLIRDYQLTL